MLADTAAPVGRHHRMTAAAWALPLLIGAAFGGYAWFLERGRDSTAGALPVGLAAGVALALVCFAVGRVQRALPREGRAGLYGGVFGCAMGFLYSLSGPSVLTAAVFGLALGAGMFAVVFYYLYTHQVPAQMGEPR